MNHHRRNVNRWDPFRYDSATHITREVAQSRVEAYIRRLDDPKLSNYARSYWKFLQGDLPIQPRWEFPRSEYRRYQEVRLYLAATLTASMGGAC